MKLSFYYVDQEYIEYLKEKEIEYRGFTTVPNLNYAKKTYQKVLEGTDLQLLKNSCAFQLLEMACREYIEKHL